MKKIKFKIIEFFWWRKKEASGAMRRWPPVK
jgi:hypothetical protein